MLDLLDYFPQQIVMGAWEPELAKQQKRSLPYPTEHMHNIFHAGAPGKNLGVPRPLMNDSRDHELFTSIVLALFSALDWLVAGTNPKEDNRFILLA